MSFTLKEKDVLMIPRKKCVVCGGKSLHKVLDLGIMPNSNEIVDNKDLLKVESYPLRFYWCQDCSLFQQLDPIEGKKLFGDKYTYETGASKPAIEHFKELAETLKRKVTRRNFAVVIGSNDGTEIDLTKRFGMFKRVIGVEPAKNIAKIANGRGLRTINDFFSYNLSKEISSKFGKADAVIANNVFAHIPNPADMLLGIKNLLEEDGWAIIEVQWLCDVVNKLSIDTLYAEHYYEWTVKAMHTLTKSCGLVLTDVTRIDQQGGSLRFWLKLRGRETRKLERLERAAGLYNMKMMQNLQKRTSVKKKRFRTLMIKLRKNGCVVDIWAVPAKVPTLLNFCKIDSRYIRYAYDSTKSKIGKYIPRAGILIKDEKLLNENMPNMPDYLIIGAWNYLDYARKKLAWFNEKGGRIINPATLEIL